MDEEEASIFFLPYYSLKFSEGLFFLLRLSNGEGGYGGRRLGRDVLSGWIGGLVVGGRWWRVMQPWPETTVLGVGGWVKWPDVLSAGEGGAGLARFPVIYLQDLCFFGLRRTCADSKKRAWPC